MEALEAEWPPDEGTGCRWRQVGYCMRCGITVVVVGRGCSSYTRPGSVEYAASGVVTYERAAIE